MKKTLFTLFLALAASVGTLFAESGTCGATLTWDLTGGVLTISGTGAMTDYSDSNHAPWYDNRSSITSVIIENGVTSIGNAAFHGCESLTSVTIPNSVTIIGERAFYGCSSLTSVTIPNSVTSIGYAAFNGCSSLTSVTIPNSVTSIGNNAFCDCSSLTSVTIPNSVTSIGAYAFWGCSGLTSVTIPNSVTSIGYYAFSGCSSLTSVTIPNSVTSIGVDAFSGCTSLPVMDNIRYADTYLVQAVDKTLSSYTIKEGTRFIGNWAFYYCIGLTSITIPNSVTSIGQQAFLDCTGLTSIEIPNSVTSIGSWAFGSCSGLTSVTIGNSVTSIGSWAFEDCSGLTSPVYNAHVFAFMPTSYSGTYSIPDGIESIAGGAFNECSGLTSVTIPNSVTSIGQQAFYYCTGLTSVTIPNSVTSIGIGAFLDCSGLTSINVASDNPNYCSVNGVLFNKNQTKLISYPGGKQGAYSIPNSVTSIEGNAFYSCSGLTSVTIGNSVTSIGGYAFHGCTGLTSVTIPNSVTSIGDWAFEDCSGLTSITCEAITPPTLGSDVFYNINKSTCVLYVPAGSISAYKSADQWKDFTNILPIGAQPADVTTTTVTPSETTADIAWPQVTGAATYTIEIKKNGELICTLTFNAQGQLISIALAAPSRNNAPQRAQAAGFSFTVTSLDSGTTYSYTLTAKDNNGNVLKTESGTFTTTGESVPTNIDEVQSDQVQNTKILRNGQIYILRGDKIYTLQGQEVQ